MRRSHCVALCAVFALASVPTIMPRATADPPGVWLAGDLHVHTIWSKDVCETPLLKNTRDPGNPARQCDDPTTWGHTPGEQLAMAAERGLNFLALTDHNTNAHLTDPEVTGYAGPLTVIPGTEFTLSGGEGHANLLGWTQGKPADPTPEDHRYTPADVESIVALAHAAGALFSINHPLNPAWGLGFPAADAVEVWNFPWASQALPVIGSENTRAIRWWETNFLARGARPAAVGGSDNHWRSDDRVQGVGQPTTWVFARDRSVSAILDGIRLGHTTVSAEPPASGGTQLFLDAGTGSGEAFGAMAGDSIPAGTVRVRVRALHATGSVLRIAARDGSTLGQWLVDGDDVSVVIATTLTRGDWVRAEAFVPDASAERGDACRALPALRDATDEANSLVVGVAENVYPGASEARPINTGPCDVVQMKAITGAIIAA